MPELPEVETIVRDLNKSLPGKTISDVIVHDVFGLRPTDPSKGTGREAEDFIRRTKGQAVERIARRGKAVIMDLASGEFLVIQLMMTGQLVVEGQKDRHTRVTFIFSDGTRLLYNDQRRFGRLRVSGNLNDIKYFSILGPEPFSKEFTADFMRRAFLKSGRPVKNLLLDHTFVAGIGNIYACEILFRSRVKPGRRARRISAAETAAIHSAVREVLKEAITHRGSSMRNYRDGSGNKGRFNERLAVYARQGLPCPCCGKPVKRMVQSGRSTFYCGQCQK
jgi:formamidopyrimidine-DNA glycosylase